MNLIESLNWRYATKRMNGTKVPQAKIDNILEAIRLSASSFGLQPFRAIVVENPDLRAQILEKACAQPQIMEGSHVIIFASWKSISDVEIGDYLFRTSQERNIPVEALSAFADMMKGSIGVAPTETQAIWSAKQAYIALGTGLAAAAMEEVDATPMEGFDANAMDEILGLSGTNLHSAVIMALGYRDAESDYLAKAKKVRLSKEDFYLMK